MITVLLFLILFGLARVGLRVAWFAERAPPLAAVTKSTRHMPSDKAAESL